MSIFEERTRGFLVTEQAKNDLIRVRARMSESLWGVSQNVDGIRQPKAGTDAARRAIEALDALVPGDIPGTLRWPDIDYADATPSSWKTPAHLSRIDAAVVALGKGKLLGQDCPEREKILGALRYFVAHDFENPNWWWNGIGLPLALGRLGVLLYDILPEELLTGLARMVAKGSLAASDKPWSMTGANMLWAADVTMRHGLLTGAPRALYAASVCAAGEMKLDEREGIQSDGSFRQHGPRWCSGSYGRSFTCVAAQMLVLLEETVFAFPRENLGIYLSHVLDGQRMICQNGYFDFNAISREISRAGSINSGLVGSLELLASCEELPRHDELAAFFDEARGVGGELTATRWYPRVTALVHREKGCYVGIKTLNNEQYDADTCNREGELCFNMTYGGHTCFMWRGDEYLDINPVFDWAHVPGTTARDEDDAALQAHKDAHNWCCDTLSNDCSGGCAVGNRGIAFERAEHDGITAQIAFFTFGGGLVALGTDIRDTRGETLHTTVEQAWSRDVEVAPDGQSALCGGFAYVNLEPGTALAVSDGEVTGNWHRNSAALPDTPVTGRVFKAFLTIPGAATAGGRGHYAYAVLPRDEVPGASVLRNDSCCQAIELADGTVMAVFHTDCELATARGIRRGIAGSCSIF